MSRRHFLSPLTSGGCADWSLAVLGRDLPLARQLECAFDSTARRRGLLGRDSLADDAALIIAPSSAVHTFRMRFPIDVVFAARDGRVLHVAQGLKPGRVAFAIRAFAVVELASGAVARSRVTTGDRLIVTRRDEGSASTE